MTPLAQLLEQAIGASRLLLYLDYDGTLARLRANPDRCALTPPLPQILISLSASTRLDLAVISGRSLQDLRKHLPDDLSQISLAGNHGLELHCRGRDWADPRAVALRPELDRLAGWAQLLLQDLPGASIEHKGLSLSLHGRGVPADREGELEQLLTPLLAAVRQHGQFQVHRGRKVLEIRPAFPHGKAIAAKQLEQDAVSRGFWRPGVEPDPLRLYFGDDQTDEDVFLHWPGVIGIHVGPGNPATAAAHRLGGPAGVSQWLAALQIGLAEADSPRICH